MERVGARLGRSSTRYGPAAVFTGPVRKWKRKWVHVARSYSSNANGAAVNGGNGSPVLLRKWAPIAHSAVSEGNGDAKSVSFYSVDDPPNKKFKYVPIAALEEEQKYDAPRKNSDEEAKAIDTDKPNINDFQLDENEDTNNVVREDLNESTVDLRLDLNGRGGDNKPDS